MEHQTETHKFTSLPAIFEVSYGGKIGHFQIKIELKKDIILSFGFMHNLEICF